MRTLLGAILMGSLVVACGGTFPVPAQPMADAESAERSARELDANKEPGAQLHLRLAQEQIAEAKRSVEEGDNERAAQILVRAKADAELALSLARELAAKVELQQAVTAKEEAPQ